MARRAMSNEMVVKRRDKILDASATLFSELGYHRATTKKIAASARVSEGTLYRYFRNKDDILIAMLARITQSERRLDALSSRSQTDDLEMVLSKQLRLSLQQPAVDNRMLAAVLSEVLVHPGLRRRYVSQRLKPSIELLEAYIRTFIARGKIRRVDAGLLARIYTAISLGLGVLRVLGEPALQRTSGRIGNLVEIITQLWVKGVGA